jgi:uncharacterized alkaline shock family protein YloU
MTLVIMTLVIPPEMIEQIEAMPRAAGVRVRQAPEQVAADLKVRVPFATELDVRATGARSTG